MNSTYNTLIQHNTLNIHLNGKPLQKQGEPWVINGKIHKVCKHQGRNYDWLGINLMINHLGEPVVKSSLTNKVTVISPGMLLGMDMLLFWINFIAAKKIDLLAIFASLFLGTWVDKFLGRI